MSSKRLALSAFESFCCATLATVVCLSPCACSAGEAPKLLLKGEVTNWLLETERELGFEVERQPRETGGTITKVKLGSPAADAGLRMGDKVVAEDVDGSKMTMRIMRDGKLYQAIMTDPSIASAPRPGTQNKDAPGANVAKLLFAGIKSADQLSDDDKGKLIAEHDLVICIDKSASMWTTDAQGLSRWDWAAMQAEKFARFYSKVARRKITITMFDDDHYTYTGGSFADIPHLFQSRRPSGNTNTADALQGHIKSLFAHDPERPMLLAVITDGQPNDKQALRDLLIDASRHTRFKGELVVDFLQIGQDPDATKYLKELDNGLVAEGAAFDLVDLHTFNDLEKLGLVNAIVDAVIETNRSQTKTGAR